MKIFMLGTQRSGSNLLRLMLNQLPDIAAPHPPHIMERLMPLAKAYGDLAQDANFELLVDDVCRLIELNPEPWEGVTLDRKGIKARCRDRSLTAVFGATYDVMAEVNHAGSWCCKSLQNILYLKELEAYYANDAKYLYLYRDGRDVACSFAEAVVGEKHAYHIAKEWGDTQRLALSQRKVIDPFRFTSLSYEHLTGNAEVAMRGLCDFMGFQYDPAMLAFNESKDAKSVAQKSDLWANVTKPVMKDNSNKFLKKMTSENIRIFELIAGDVLDELGYKRFHSAVGEIKAFSAEDIKAFDAENERLKAAVLAEVNPEDMKRRALQAGLLKEIKGRKVS